MLGFEVFDEGVEEVVRSFDAVLLPEPADTIDVFLTVEEGGKFPQVVDNGDDFLGVCGVGGHRWEGVE